MSVLNAIRGTGPTSYWPLDDDASATTVHDEMQLHDGIIAERGVYPAVVPFGRKSAPFFNGEVGSAITVPDDPCYSHTHANALTVAAWIMPAARNFRLTDGTDPNEQYVHYLEKGVRYNADVEWALRLYNADGGRPSRLSFYMFNSGSPVGKGAGSYMQYGRSVNDLTPVEPGRWLFLVGQAEPYVDADSTTTGTAFFKQGVAAKRIAADKYNTDDLKVRPHDADGPIVIGGSIGKTAFRGAIAHVAIWNRLLSTAEIELIRSEGVAERGRHFESFSQPEKTAYSDR